MPHVWLYSQSQTDWKEAERGQVNVETLEAANRVRLEFMSAVQETHARNLNDFKLRGVLTNDAPLPLLELNSVFVRPPLISRSVPSEPLHFWPFRCAVAPRR